jgi:hypothetical protein
MEHHIGNLVTYLATGKEITSAAVLTKEFLHLRTGNLKGTKETDDTPLIHLEPLSRVDSREYGEFLKNNYPDFLNAAPREALSLVIDILEEALHIEGYGQKDDFQDYSGRPAIEDHDQNPILGEPKDLLITAVRDSAVHCIKMNPENFEEIFQEFNTKHLSIFKRISLYLIRLFGNEHHKLVENRILDRDQFNNYWTRYEYVHLIQDYFSTLSSEKQKIILGWIREVPKIPGGEKIQLIHKEHWQLRWLTILKGQLPALWEKKRLNLLKKYREPDHPDLLSWSSETMSGPTSPVSPEQIKTMSTDDLIAFLHYWKAPSGFTMDSPEGISRSLASAISDDPTRFANDAEKFIGCDPTYVHGVFDGLHQALKPEKRFDWSTVVKLMNWVVKQGREIPGRQAGESWDIDPDWGWTRTEISRLLESGFNATKNPIPYGLKRSVWKVLLPLTDDPDPTPDEESNISMDPATNSLNTTRGTAFHALIAYALWVKRNIIKRTGKNDKEIDFKSDMPDVLDVLEKHLDPIYDPSSTIRAVYGITFSNLAYLDRKWSVDNKERIFPKNVESRRFWNAAWSSLIGFNNPKPYLFQDLFSEYLFSTSIVDSTPTKASWGNNPNERLAEHLMVYYAWNKLQLDSEIMEIFWSRSTPDLKSHAIEFIGRTGKEASPEAISRFKNLWENRLLIAIKADYKNPYIDELKAFGWWFVSESYDDDWCLSQLEKVLQITGEIEYDHGVVERLASLSDKYPLQTVGLVESLVEGEKKGWGISLWTGNIGTILQKALSSKNTDAHKAAEALINRLAARGYPDFGNLLMS